MNPIDHPELYESIVLDGIKSPGRVTLSGHERAQPWEIAKAKGQTGATTTLTGGGDPGKFTATFHLAKDPSDAVDEFARWDEFRTLIESSTNGATPKALPIYHPDLEAQHFSVVVLSKMGGMQHDGKGGATIAVEFLEYRPKKPKKVGGASMPAAERQRRAQYDADRQAEERYLAGAQRGAAEAQAAADAELAKLRAQAGAP